MLPTKKLGEVTNLSCTPSPDGTDFRLNIGKPARSVEHANALPDLVAVQRRAGLLRKQVKQVMAIAIGLTPSISTDLPLQLTVVGWRSRRGHLLRICRQRQHRDRPHQESGQKCREPFWQRYP